ncbi:hypothetical protein Suden_0651 [Sulfurimonas denitrificans DSM 1251]|uniref:Uncharacterized protein n=1 Tax=Sulfurimonas denitrificans (strain ATCC 33889 / DSM 1251) TaxID=326298 RepID=Q30SV1_SULDN|nr:CsgG/HfaB family protein [Sulfurimonas denitrificans]ABB43930.1 hypothetical protein Suden_0651 [Sulfurimonas denitrificans DSM 1251]MDD3443587.1 CsgG/HfaB family protein [Sulfurimonas denitrificans]
MQVLKWLILAFLLTVFLAGCSHRVAIRALEPAEIDRATLTRKISVTNFENDSVGLSNKIETKIISKKIDDKSYFTLISRKDFDKIISEQKIQNSGLVDISTAVEVGNILGAEAIISGGVGRVAFNDTTYYERRIRCNDKKCKSVSEYSVRCIKRNIGLSADLRMIDIAKGDIIYANTFNKSGEWSHCVDDSRSLPSVEIVAQNLANIIADEFTSKLTPHYRYFEVTLLDTPDIKYTSKDKELLEVSIEYIKQDRYDKAQKFLIDLIDSTNKKSYVAFYNLGVVKEAEGNYQEAKEYYKMADDLMIKPVEEISSATLRIEELIKKHNRATQQLNQ